MSHRSFRLGLAGLAFLAAVGCATPDQRLGYRSTIEQFAPKLPKSNFTCWLTPDLNGTSAGSDAVAEEEFYAYLLKNGLCRVIEKHPDAVVGYAWPKEDVCPCKQSEQGVCTQCGGSGTSAPASALGGMLSVSSVGFGGDDNNRSSDKLLERYKKSTLPQKLIVYRIDELTNKKCVVHFRVADAKTGVVDQAGTMTHLFEQPAAARE